MTETWEYGEAAGPSFPWPPAEGAGVLGSFGETWRSATFDPGAFFPRMPRDGGTPPAVLYYLVIGVLVAGASLFWNSLAVIGGRADETVASGAASEAFSPIVGFLLSPVLLLVALVVSAAVVHVLLIVMGGARHGFGTTVRVFSYAYSPMVFGVVPVLGTITGSIWMVVLAVVGLREAHGTDGWKAGVAVVLPFVLLVGLAMLFLAMLATGAALLTG